MEPDIVSQIIESGAAIATLVGSGTVKAIAAKVQSLKDEKSVDKVRAGYDEILTQLLQERSDAILLAQAYKDELDKIKISDEDIVHLQNTVSNVLDIIKQFSPETSTESYETFKDLISADTLKTMQLLGFNYKAAIGEPLTELCADAIKNFAKNKTQTNQNRSGKKR